MANDPWGIGGGSSGSKPTAAPKGPKAPKQGGTRNIDQAVPLLQALKKQGATKQTSAQLAQTQPHQAGRIQNQKRQFAGLVAGMKSSDLQQIEKKTGTSDGDILSALEGTGTGLPDSGGGGAGGFLDNAVNDLGNVISSVPRGVVGSAAAAGHEIAHGVADAFTYPFGHNPTPEKALSNLSHLATGNPTAQQQKDSPFTSATVESVKQTANRLSDPQQFLHDYSAHPFSSLAQDVGNASLILAPASKVLEPLSAAAEGSHLAPLAAAGRAGSAVAHGLELGSDVAGKINQGPFLPYTAPARLANKGAHAVADLAEKVAPNVLKPLTLDTAGREARATIRAGVEQQRAIPIQQARLGKQIEHLLPSHDEQAAYTLVGQGEAPALSKLRQGAPDKFDAFVNDLAAKGDVHVTPAAAHLAADVVEGKNPELAARIDEALKVHQSAPGGAAEREALHLEGPTSRIGQYGYEADPIAVQKVLKPLQAKLDRATNIAKNQRLRADAAAATEKSRAARSVDRIEGKRYSQSGRMANALGRVKNLQADERVRAEALAAERGAQRESAIEGRARDQATLEHKKDLGRQVIHAHADERRARDLVAGAQREYEGRASLLENARYAAALGDSSYLDEVRSNLDAANEQLGRAVDAAESAKARRSNLERSLSQASAAPISRAPVPPALNVDSLLRQRGTRPRQLEAERTLAREQTRLASLERLKSSAEARAAEPVDRFGKSQDSLAKRAEKVQGRLEARLQAAEASARNDIGNAPARLRPALSINRAVQSTLAEHTKALTAAGVPDAARDVGILADEIPTTLAHMQAAGVDPQHFIHVQFTDKPLPTGTGRVQFPSVKKTSQARYRGTGTAFDRTVKGQAQGEIKLFRQQIQNETADTIAQLPLAAHLGQGALEGVTTKEEALAAGYSPLDLRNPFETPSSIDENTVFVPTHVKTAFRRYFDTPSRFEKGLGMVFDPLTRVYKASVLALSPAWHIGKLVSDFFLSSVGGGVSPVTLAAEIPRAIAKYRASGEPGLRQYAAPDRLLAHGPAAEANDFLNGARTHTAIGRVAGAPAQAGYHVFQTMDNVMRSAFYLAKKSQGYTDEQAVSIGLRTLGDFQNLSPFERNVVRRVIPFYAWQKHITKLAFSLPIEHPIRTAWTLKLAQEFGQPDAWEQDLPSFLKTAVGVGSGLSLVPGRMFPFPVNPLEQLSGAGIGASLNPLIRLGLQNDPLGPGRGINLTTGMPFTRPPGTGREDQFGRLLPTAPSLLQQLRGLVPQSKLVDELSGRKDVARYDTGQPITFKTPDQKVHEIPTPQDATQSALKALGIPIENTSDLQSLALGVAQKKAKNAKQAASKKPVKKPKAKASSGGSSSTSSDPWGLK